MKCNFSFFRLQKNVTFGYVKMFFFIYLFLQILDLDLFKKKTEQSLDSS